MAIKQFETRKSLVFKLKTRGLIDKEDRLAQVLVEKNYYSLFNGLENLLLSCVKPKQYYGVTLEDFECLYSFDRALSGVIFSILNRLEEFLKTSIAYHFAKIHCSTLADTMQYTNKNKFMNPRDSNSQSPTYCPYSNNYPFAKAQNGKIIKDFNNFAFFDPAYLDKLIKHNDHIDSKFYQSPNYIAPKGVAIYHDKQKNKGRNIAVPLWVAIEALTFGELLRLLHYLQDDVLELVLNDFNLPKSKRSEFLNMIDFLLYLRNSCAHGSLINRFTTPLYCKINQNLVKSFKLTPKKHLKYQDSNLSLFDVLKILSFFYSLMPLKKLFKNLIYANHKRMGWKRGRELNQKLLARMGCLDYKQWKILFDGKNKFIL
ncbi:Abi family protein [uncultured Streptococcus sp.]|uniref:Abi family protein n=1 Tax=uncultured Streptococcus sp. TaxID=83427 RepID=UPI003211A1B0